jgi:hypothetical protein
MIKGQPHHPIGMLNGSGAYCRADLLEVEKDMLLSQRKSVSDGSLSRATWEVSLYVDLFMLTQHRYDLRFLPVALSY